MKTLLLMLAALCAMIAGYRAGCIEEREKFKSISDARKALSINSSSEG